ncbi:MAG TPA: helix-turn-helix domain-containing protein [Minicystis sp.]|nr:helix-turn-helix domain-containing protein [Minicystis sp.]
MATKSTTKSSTKLTPAEVAARLGRDAKWVRTMIRSGRIKATAASTDGRGSRWAVTEAEVKRLESEAKQ